MKILFLTSEGFDTPNSTNHLCETLLEDMLKAGIAVHSITSHKTGKYADIPEKLLAYGHFEYSIIQRDNIDKNNFVKRYLDEIKYAFKAKKIWKKHKKEYDAVLMQSNPNSVFNAVLLKSALKKPIVLNLYDVFPGHAKSIGVIKSSFVYEVLRKIQRVLYRKCDYIVSMSDDMKAQLIAEKVPEKKIKVINCWFDNSVFQDIPREENRFFARNPELDKNKFYVQFAGLLGYVFDYKMFVDTAALLEKETDIEFLLIGDGTQRSVVLDEIKKRGLKNIRCYSWQPLEIIADVYSACDVGIIPLKPGVIGNGVPSKACQLMAARRVIINSVEESGYTKLFERNEMGINVITHKPEDVAAAILKLKNNPKLRKKLGDNAHAFSYQNYSREMNTQKFIDVITSLGKEDT